MKFCRSNTKTSEVTRAQVSGDPWSGFELCRAGGVVDGVVCVKGNRVMLTSARSSIRCAFSAFTIFLRECKADNSRTRPQI